MKIKCFFLVLLMMFTSVSFSADKSDNWKDSEPIPGGDDGKSRSVVADIVVHVEADLLSVDIPIQTTSRIVIENAEECVVFDQTYPASSSVQVDLSTLPSGSYYLYIYAYDCWCVGEFEL
jgi:hypothetical protein